MDVGHIGFGDQEGPKLKKGSFQLVCHVIILMGKREFICTSSSSGTRDIVFNDFSSCRQSPSWMTMSG